MHGNRKSMGWVRTLTETRRELTELGHYVELLTPEGLTTLPCPSYPDIRLTLFAGRAVRNALKTVRPDAIHIATEGPLGLAARRVCGMVCRLLPPITPVSQNIFMREFACRWRSVMRGCAGFIGHRRR